MSPCDCVIRGYYSAKGLTECGSTSVTVLCAGPRTVPYQVELKGGRLIYAPVDDDQLIASAAQPLSEPGLLEAVSEHMPVSVGDIPRGERVAWLQRTLHASHHSDDDGSSLGATLNAEEAAATERTHILYREHVQKKYPRLHPQLFDVSKLDSFIEHTLRDAIVSGNGASQRALLKEESRENTPAESGHIAPPTRLVLTPVSPPPTHASHPLSRRHLLP